MKRRKRIACMLMFFLMICLIWGQPVNAGVKEQKASIQLSKKKDILVAGKTFQYKITYIDGNGTKTEISGKDAAWSVSDSEVASITKQGKLKAKRVGTVIITAQYRDLKTTYKVEVKGKKVIGIDAGHQAKGNSSKEAIGPGASTKKAKVASGTTGVSSKMPEYQFTLMIAKQLKEELIDRGYEVVMTRTTNDVDLSNKERALLLNKSCDIGIHLHCDGFSNGTVKGATALYTSTRNKYVPSSISKKSKVLADQLMAKYCFATGIKNLGGVLRDDLTGNNWSTIPTVTLEMGFMSNKEEDTWMQKKDHQKKMIKGIADGIDAYWKD